MSAQSDCNTEGCARCEVSNSGDLFLCPLHKSAPELLEAAKEALDLIEMLAPHGPSVKAKLQAAIKKSNGGFPS